MTPEEFRRRLFDLFLYEGRPYGMVKTIHDAQQAYGERVVQEFSGHFALSDSFKALFIETTELMNTHCRETMKAPLSEHFAMFLPRLVHAFHIVCGAEASAIRGYPRPAFTTLRNVFDDCVMTSAALQRITTFYAIEGLDPKAQFDPATYKTLRKKEEFRVNGLMTSGPNTNLEQATLDALKKLNDLYDMEVHGSRLSMTDSMAFMKQQGPLHVVPMFKPMSFALFMNRFTEVTWLIHRLLPAVQPPDAPMPDEWVNKWQVIDESYDIVLKALHADAGKAIGQEFPKFVAAKFPFNAKSVFPL